MSETAVDSAPASKPADEADKNDDAPHLHVEKKKRRKRHWFRFVVTTLLVLVVVGVVCRMMLPTWVRWYVNRTLDRDPVYDGEIGDVYISLWKGQYSIEAIRINKKTGNVPVPLFAAKRVDLAVEWGALMDGAIVGRIFVETPELNFVDDGQATDSGDDQTGTGGPWLQIIRDLFPFDINSAKVSNGSVHFRKYGKDPQVNVYINRLDAEITNLRNTRDETKPLFSEIVASGTAMDSGKFDLDVKFDPFSYRPTFQAAVKLIGLDVTKTNDLIKAYGNFDFEQGFFDLVVELDAKEGGIEGYVKPLFRNLKVLSLRQDLKEDNVLQVFWEALVGGTQHILKNQPRDQFATLIPLSGRLDGPNIGIFPTLLNVLRNAFIRAYLPRLQGTAEEAGAIQFKPGGSVTDADAPGNFSK